MDPRVRLPHDTGRDHEHAQRGRGPRRPRLLRGARPQARAGVLEPAGRRGDLRRRAERHQRHARAARASLRRTGLRVRRAGPRRRRGGRHGHDLSRLQGRHGDRIASDRGRGGHLDRGRPGAVELRRPGASDGRRRPRRRGDPDHRALLRVGRRGTDRPRCRGLDHRRGGDRRTTPAAPAGAHGAAGGPGHRAGGRRRQQLERRHLPGVLHGERRTDEEPQVRERQEREGHYRSTWCRTHRSRPCSGA